MNKPQMSNAMLNGKLAIVLSSASEVDALLDILEGKGYPTLYRWREFLADNGISPESDVYAIIRNMNDEPIFCVLTLELLFQWLDDDEHMAVKYDTANQIDFI